MFGPRRDERRSAAIRALKATARALFEAGEDDAVHKLAAEVTEDDLRAAIQGGHEHEHPRA